MSFSRSSKTNKQRHKKVLKMAKGYRSRAKSCFRISIERVEKGLQYAYKHRRTKKRDFRSLWIQRINAAVRQHGLVYSQFIQGLKLSGLTLDRKVLSDLAIKDPEGFKTVVDSAVAALSEKKAA